MTQKALHDCVRRMSVRILEDRREYAPEDLARMYGLTLEEGAEMRRLIDARMQAPARPRRA